LKPKETKNWSVTINATAIQAQICRETIDALSEFDTSVLTVDTTVEDDVKMLSVVKDAVMEDAGDGGRFRVMVEDAVDGEAADDWKMLSVVEDAVMEDAGDGGRFL
jgi:hypothetical protein